MKKEYKFLSTTVAIVTIMVLTGCNIWHKPDINGSKRQPIMHGWTLQQAGEYWLQSDLDVERSQAIHSGGEWMTAEQLASLDDENVKVNLPLAPEGANPLPRNGIEYRQADTEGFITFNFNEKELAADTILSEYLAADSLTIKQLMTVGKAQVNLKEPLYFINDTTLNCYVQQRGRGIYTLYYVTDRGTRHYPHGRLRSIAAVISVYEGADSLVICRGNMLGAAYKAKKN